ncbi:T9SS sorting signal type C domain-containing protein [Flavobacterium sp.]|uniref:T9SS sorting signal type C domain-containing protein n=1 Tax=Flavobacterium sp. TaxID=239 RepID=UPI0037BEE55B
MKLTKCYMKCFFIIIFLPSILFSQIAYRSKQSGVWSDFNTWQRFNGTSWVNASLGQVPSNSDGIITIVNGHIVTINSNLNIDQTTINQGGKLVLVSGNLTVENGIGTDLIISGTYERTSLFTTMTTNGTVSCESTGVYEHNTAGGSLPSITWKDGSILKIKNSLQNNLFQSFWDVWVEGGTASSVTFDNNVSRTMTVRNDFRLIGGDFFLKNGGSVGGTHTLRVKGNFLQSGGSFAWNSDNNDNVSIVKIEVEKDLIISGGNWSGFVSSVLCDCGVFFLGNGVEQTYSTILAHDNSGAVRNRFYYKTTSGPSALHEIYNGSIAQFTINGNCGTGPIGFTPWPSTGSLLKTVTIDNSSGVTLQSPKSVRTSLFLKNGIFNLNNQTFTMTNGSTIDRTGGTISATPAGSSFNVLYSPHSAGFTTEFELPNSTTVLNNFTINNGNTITLQSNKTVNGNLTLTSGVFDITDKTINRNNIGGILNIADNAKLKIGGTNSFPTNYTTHDINDNSIVEYAGSSQVIATTNKTNDYDYGFLELSGTGTKTLEGVVDVYNDLTINGGNLLVNTGQILRVGDEFKNMAGTATFENNASLIQVNNVSNTGNITYKRIAQQRNLDYVYWSSPVNNFHLNNHPSDGLKYLWNTTLNNTNGTQGNWQSASGIMNAAQGYIIRGPNSFSNTTNQNLEVPFLGTPRNGDISRNIFRGNYTGANYFLSSGAQVTNIDDNWNLIGNPYPSAISSREFLINNSSVLTGALYIWTHGFLPSSMIGSPFYQNFAYNYNPLDYIPFNLTGNLASPNPDYFIGAGQGFFVTMIDGSTATSTVNFTNNLRNKTYTNSTGINFFRLANTTTVQNQTEFNRIWLDIIKQGQPGGRTMFGYVTGATMQKDNLHDATTKSNNSFKLYTLLAEEKFIIQGRALPFDNNDVVPLGVDILENGFYTIALAMTDGLFENNNQDIFLEDLYTNTIHDLKTTPYLFSSNAGSFTDRFLIKYINLSNLNTIENNWNNSITIWTNEKINIKSNLEIISDVSIFDITGRKINSFDNISSNRVEISNLIKTSNNYYLIKIKLNNGVIVFKKIVF